MIIGFIIFPKLILLNYSLLLGSSHILNSIKGVYISQNQEKRKGQTIIYGSHWLNQSCPKDLVENTLDKVVQVWFEKVEDSSMPKLVVSRL